MTFPVKSVLACSASLCCALASVPSFADTHHAFAAVTAAQKDAVDLTRDATDARVRETRLFTRHDGGSVWLDLNGAVSESKAMGDDAGYKSRLGALHLGADIKTGTALFGVAYSYGRGDIDTTGLTKNLDGETEFFGVRIYGEKTWGPLGVRGALSWLKAKGGTDTTTGESHNTDADIFTAEAGGDFLMTEGVVKVLAHADAKATKINPDNFSDAAVSVQPDNALYWEFPVGVTVASEFDAAGFTVKPLADISFVSTAGDRETVTHLQGVTHSMRFADTRCWRMAFGVAAQGKKGSLGLTYRLDLGENDRRNHAVTLDGKYTF